MLARWHVDHVDMQTRMARDLANSNRNRNHYGEPVALYTGFFLFYSLPFWNKNAILADNNYS